MKRLFAFVLVCACSGDDHVTGGPDDDDATPPPTTLDDTAPAHIQTDFGTFTNADDFEQVYLAKFCFENNRCLEMTHSPCPYTSASFPTTTGFVCAYDEAKGQECIQTVWSCTPSGAFAVTPAAACCEVCGPNTCLTVE